MVTIDRIKKMISLFEHKDISYLYQGLDKTKTLIIKDDDVMIDTLGIKMFNFLLAPVVDSMYNIVPDDRVKIIGILKNLDAALTKINIQTFEHAGDLGDDVGIDIDIKCLLL